MLKENNRLKAKRAFSATYNNRSIINSESIVLYAGKYKNDESCPTRVGFVVSKKVHKRAVKRNRAKRLMRETVRLLLKDNNKILNSFQSLIFIARSSIVEKNHIEIRNTILTLLEKLAIKNI